MALKYHKSQRESRMCVCCLMTQLGCQLTPGLLFSSKLQIMHILLLFALRKLLDAFWQMLIFHVGVLLFFKDLNFRAKKEWLTKEPICPEYFKLFPSWWKSQFFNRISFLAKLLFPLKKLFSVVFFVCHLLLLFFLFDFFFLHYVVLRKWWQHAKRS